MNILIFISKSRYSNYCVGGAETSLELIATQLALHGDHVCVATLTESDGAFIPKEQAGGVVVYRLKHAAPAGKESSSLEIQKFVADIVKSENIQLVHTYEIIDTSIVLKSKEAYKLNIKILKRAAGLYWTYCLDTGRLTKMDVESVFNFVDEVNFLTPFFKTLVLEKMKQYGIAYVPRKQVVMDIGINLNLFRYRRKPAHNKIFRIICVAKFLGYQKRQDILIQALSRLEVDFRVDFVGTGLTLANHQDLCRQFNIADKAMFHGYLEQKKVAAMLAQADLFVLPTDYEGLPKAMLEAMAVGVPCLVSDVMPLNYYVQEGKTGFLVKNTVEEWVNKLNWIQQRPAQFSGVPGQARIFVEQNFNSVDNIIKYRHEFQELISS